MPFSWGGLLNTLFPRLVHVAERAGTGAAGIAARSAGAGRGRRSRRAFCGNGEDRELRLQLGGMALGTLGLLLAIDEGLEPVMAFFADVLEDGHG